MPLKRRGRRAPTPNILTPRPTKNYAARFVYSCLGRRREMTDKYTIIIKGLAMPTMGRINCARSGDTRCATNFLFWKSSGVGMGAIP